MMKRLCISLALGLVLLLSLAVHARVEDRGGDAFEYMEVYMPPLPGGGMAALRLGNVDEDWGLWGHNLPRVLPLRPSASVFAWHDGERDEEQFCFSSDTLFDYIVDYITENFGPQPAQRFAVIPNDNSVVCQCDKCRRAGNTGQDASPAVFNMLERLARRFPRHIFFTSDYSTTRGLPRRPLPDNTGVLVSAMDYSLSPIATPEEERFSGVLSRWNAVSKNVYVWDYVCNFDDYLTPFPVFSIMQRRLRLYAKAGVKGVFLNGSGPDYSSMSVIKVCVLAALLKSPDTDWRSFLTETCRARYPESGQLIARFLLGQEDWVAQRGRKLPLYGGMKEALGSYLPEADFAAFHEALGAMLPQLSGRELEEVSRLWGGLAYTRLEQLRLRADTLGAEVLLRRLEAFADGGVTAYSEAGWSLHEYVADYRGMLAHATATGTRNVLRGHRLRALSALDEDYADTRMLTDGLTGLPSNYHCGQLISSVSPELRLALPQVPQMRLVRVWATDNPRFRIAAPQYVTLSAGGREVARAVPVASGRGHMVAELNIPPGTAGELVLTCVKAPEARTMALEEVEGFD